MIPKSLGKLQYRDARKAMWGDLFPHKPKKQPERRIAGEEEGGNKKVKKYEKKDKGMMIPIVDKSDFDDDSKEGEIPSLRIRNYPSKKKKRNKQNGTGDKQTWCMKLRKYGTFVR